MEENRIIILTDENGDEVEFEIVADMEYDDKEYALLGNRDNPDEVVIFQVIDNGDDATFVLVEDMDLLETLIEEYNALDEEK